MCTCFLPPTHVPLYSTRNFPDSCFQRVPKPWRLLSSHSPSYLSPLAYVRVPLPGAGGGARGGARRSVLGLR
jgi:hypothetical protein